MPSGMAGRPDVQAAAGAVLVTILSLGFAWNDFATIAGRKRSPDQEIHVVGERATRAVHQSRVNRSFVITTRSDGSPSDEGRRQAFLLIRPIQVVDNRRLRAG